VLAICHADAWTRAPGKVLCYKTIAANHLTLVAGIAAELGAEMHISFNIADGELPMVASIEAFFSNAH
jgi:hypothetical protein